MGHRHLVSCAYLANLGRDCEKNNSAHECATTVDLGSGDKPSHNNPLITMGCSDASWFRQIGGQRNKCYNK
ncbi:hypothetical protein pdam_00020167 [Pocillopora damicornis]|uniref:Uncharacterized protein n=1 Tax=Pocillopora damicornis TaxID=46731 RepID=A0A3M6TPD5_POCDA|nr:hypothetical protein pdam_00020167 [Pocillopora damicornis]